MSVSWRIPSGRGLWQFASHRRGQLAASMTQATAASASAFPRDRQSHRHPGAGSGSGAASRTPQHLQHHHHQHVAPAPSSSSRHTSQGASNRSSQHRPSSASSSSASPAADFSTTDQHHAYTFSSIPEINPTATSTLDSMDLNGGASQRGRDRAAPPHHDEHDGHDPYATWSASANTPPPQQQQQQQRRVGGASAQIHVQGAAGRQAGSNSKAGVPGTFGYSQHATYPDYQANHDPAYLRYWASLSPAWQNYHWQQYYQAVASANHDGATAHYSTPSSGANYATEGASRSIPSQQQQQQQATSTQQQQQQQQSTTVKRRVPRWVVFFVILDFGLLVMCAIVFFVYVAADLSDQLYLSRGRTALATRIMIERAVRKRAKKKQQQRHGAFASDAATADDAASADRNVADSSDDEPDGDDGKDGDAISSIIDDSAPATKSSAGGDGNKSVRVVTRPSDESTASGRKTIVVTSRDDQGSSGSKAANGRRTDGSNDDDNDKKRGK